MNRRFTKSCADIGRRFIPCAAVFMFILMCASFAGARTPSSDDTVFTWHEGARTMRARMALDEAALLTVKGTAPDEARARSLFHSAARAEKHGSLILLRSPEAFSYKDMTERIRNLGALDNVSAASCVLYHGATRLVPTGRIICRFPASYTDDMISSVEASYGLCGEKERTPGGFRIYRASDPLRSMEIAEALAVKEGLPSAYPDMLRERSRRALPNDPLFPSQWHLRNTGQSGGTTGEDINVTAVWESFRGSANEVIAVVDDGLEIAHEDLAPNILIQHCRDFLSDDADPTGGDHGTACAGLAAGRGFNGLGVVGAAPWARLAGLRIMDDAGYIADSDETASLSYRPQNIDIYSNSWGPTDPVIIPERPSPATEAAIEAGVMNGRGGLGNIYLWAAGNGYADGDNANLDGYANSRYVIAVGSSTDTGAHASYSEEGANILVNAPSSNGTGTTTTDRTGDAGYNWSGDSHIENYTNAFGGTSVSTPLAAGVIALMLQANPALTWRDIRYILAGTAEMNDPADSDWTVNGAGYHINHKYGFGRIDAAAAISAALSWHSVDDVVTTDDTHSPLMPIPDNDTTGVSDTITVSEDFIVEHVEVDFSAADHAYWTDLEIILTSPDGTESVLARQHTLPSRPSLYEYTWRFGSVRHLGESAKGAWRLDVRDRAPDDTGTFRSWTLRLYGLQGVFTITAHAGDNGAICPDGDVTVSGGASHTFTMIPDDGCCVSDVRVDGDSIGAVPQYTFSNVTSDRTITVDFCACRTITATAGVGGAITPSGPTGVCSGGSRTFTIAPGAGYRIRDVLVDGESAGVVTTYTFDNVMSDHTIEVLFETDGSHLIAASASPGGTIEPAGDVHVEEGKDVTFTIAPDAGFVIDDVLVDGESVGDVTMHTFDNVTDNHTIEALFKKEKSSDGDGGAGCFIDSTQNH